MQNANPPLRAGAEPRAGATGIPARRRGSESKSLSVTLPRGRIEAAMSHTTPKPTATPEELRSDANQTTPPDADAPLPPSGLEKSSAVEQLIPKPGPEVEAQIGAMIPDRG